MTKLKPIFISVELKKLIEFHKAIKNFKDIGSALIDLLESSEKYKQTKDLHKLVEPAQKEEKEPKEANLQGDSTAQKEKVEEILNDEIGDIINI